MRNRPTAPREVIGDPARFREWYEASLPSVYGYLLSRCGHDPALAEELTQQTYERAIRHADRFEGRSDPVTWLCAIGRNQLVDHFRRAKKSHLRDARLRADARASAEGWRGTEVLDAVERTLASMRPDQRLALIFRYLDDLPVRDVARLLRRSESATESLLSRARDAFRRAHGED